LVCWRAAARRRAGSAPPPGSGALTGSGPRRAEAARRALRVRQLRRPPPAALRHGQDHEWAIRSPTSTANSSSRSVLQQHHPQLAAIAGVDQSRRVERPVMRVSRPGRSGAGRSRCSRVESRPPSRPDRAPLTGPPASPARCWTRSSPCVIGSTPRRGCGPPGAAGDRDQPGSTIVSRVVPSDRPSGPAASPSPARPRHVPRGP